MNRMTLPKTRQAEVHTVEVIRRLEIRFTMDSEGRPSTEYPEQYHIDQRMQELYARHQKAYGARIEKGINAETFVTIQSTDPTRPKSRGAYMVCTTIFSEAI